MTRILLALLLGFLPASAVAGTIDQSTWIDHDARPIHQPRDWQPAAFQDIPIREGILDPVAHIFDVPDKLLACARLAGIHSRRPAVDVNAFDEVPSSSWFTNRNHVRAVPVEELRQGPDSTDLPEKPWRVRSRERGGTSSGFTIQDARGRKWLVKLDPRGNPQLGSGADMVARTLLHAAGYNVPHNEPVRFQGADLILDPSPDAKGSARLSSRADLDSVLARGAVLADGSYSALASLFLPGHGLGSPSMKRARPGDSNDWYSHSNRRELRGLYVICSWIGDWDTKSTNFLDNFSGAKDSGHVEHYLLDVGSSLGAQSNRPKDPYKGYEMAFDPGAIGRRLFTFGFTRDRWRTAHQASGLPSVGNFESVAFDPSDFAPEVENPAFRALTDRDGYWGAKIVASFSNAQIEGAVDAAHYEDPRARDYIVGRLIERRDKIARYWFGRVAPLDFFRVEGDTLRFHDLAAELGWSAARSYEVIRIQGRRQPRQRLAGTAVAIGDDGGPVRLEISISGSHAAPAEVELTRAPSGWSLAEVRHGL